MVHQLLKGEEECSHYTQDHYQLQDLQYSLFQDKQSKDPDGVRCITLLMNHRKCLVSHSHDDYQYLKWQFDPFHAFSEDISQQ